MTTIEFQTGEAVEITRRIPGTATAKYFAPGADQPSAELNYEPSEPEAQRLMDAQSDAELAEEALRDFNESA